MSSTRQTAWVMLTAMMTIVPPAAAGAQQGPPAAQAPVSRPGPPVPIWPEGVPNAIAGGGPEVVTDGRISNVHEPSLTPYLVPAGARPATAVIVCPGGGYSILAADHEGRAVAEWLNSLGVSAFVLKYRLKEYGHPAPLRDVLRAVRLLRSDAPRWGIAPDRHWRARLLRRGTPGRIRRHALRRGRRPDRRGAGCHQREAGLHGPRLPGDQARRTVRPHGVRQSTAGRERHARDARALLPRHARHEGDAAGVPRARRHRHGRPGREQCRCSPSPFGRQACRSNCTSIRAACTASA